jgi:hypothetical protein
MNTFILEITESNDAFIAQIWSNDDAFGMPLSTSLGDTANEAVKDLIESLNFNENNEDE